MRILVLGGTRFVGRHIVERALERGHDLTLFNRGKTAPDAFSNVVQLTGDRDGDLAALQEGEWDVVVDTCAYVPRVVREALEVIGTRAAHYVFISTISVYDEFDPDGYDEDAPLSGLEDRSSEEVTSKTYGGLKVLCEEEAARFHGTVSIVRPGLVVGPRDHTDRFTYWPVRRHRRERMLAPGSPDDPIQYIDARDLGDFVVGLCESGDGGTYNAVTPRLRYTIGDLLEACAAATEHPAQLVWVDADFLHEREVRAWNDLPGWVPPGSRIAGIPHARSERAVGAGLTFRSLGETVADTLQWFLRERDDELSAGISPTREDELLDEWDA